MKFVGSIFEKLTRHPKRIVFPDGAEPRVIAAAAEFVVNKLGVAILLGKKAEIEKIAASENISLNRILIIDPTQADDLPLFVRSLETLNRYRGIAQSEAAQIITHPNYFAAMMLLHGQADGLVGGVSSSSGSLLRPLFQIIKPLPGVKTIFGAMVMEVPNSPYGEDGVFLMGDCGVIPNPSVDQLSNIAVESGRLFRQLTGALPRIAMLSYSTKGSAQTQDTEKIVAATALARQRFAEMKLDMEIDGELQVDAALVKDIADLKAQGSPVAGRANVLIFPDLNSGNISSKLIQRLTNADAYGQILLGLDKPAADLSRGATVRDIVGVAAIVGLQAIAYRLLYPEQGARYDSNPLH